MTLASSLACNCPAWSKHAVWATCNHCNFKDNFGGSKRLDYILPEVPSCPDFPITMILEVRVSLIIPSAWVIFYWNCCRSINLKPPKVTSGDWLLKLLKVGHSQGPVKVWGTTWLCLKIPSRFIPALGGFTTLKVDPNISTFLHVFLLNGSTERFPVFFPSVPLPVVTALTQKISQNSLMELK